MRGPVFDTRTARLFFHQVCILRNNGHRVSQTCPGVSNADCRSCGRFNRKDCVVVVTHLLCVNASRSALKSNSVFKDFAEFQLLYRLRDKFDSKIMSVGLLCSHKVNAAHRSGFGVDN